VLSAARRAAPRRLAPPRAPIVIANHFRLGCGGADAAAAPAAPLRRVASQIFIFVSLHFSEEQCSASHEISIASTLCAQMSFAEILDFRSQSNPI